MTTVVPSSTPTPPIARGMLLQDSLPRELFDRVARLGSAALQVPVAVVVLGEDGRTIVRGGSDLPDAMVAGREVPPAYVLPRAVVDAGEPVVVAAVAPPTASGTPARLAFTAMPFADPDSRVAGALYALGLPGRPGVRVPSADCVAVLADLAALLVSDIVLRRDLDEHTQVQRQLRHNTLHDTLTQLPNRTLFMERLGHAIMRAKRHPEYRFAVLFLDLDRFKVVNDSLGHQAGDQLLVTVARRLEVCLREDDTVARLGGDEFAVLLESITEISDAGRIAERIQRALSAPVNLNGYEVFTSVSIGVVDSSSAHGQAEYLLRNADMAMYRAKASGKARYEMFDRAMHAQALARLQVETDLRRALDRSEFRVYYQPVVALQSGRIVGLEALLRWEHPQRGLVPPGEFIPTAEEMGLVLPLGRWVLQEACRQLRAWQEDFPRDVPLSVGVNISVKQFAQPDLAQQVAGTLADTGLAPESLKLEITESVIVENPDSAAGVLGEMKRLGVEVYMDDFGTGYSSLSYLTRLPIDAIKIDRAFVSHMEAEDKHFQLVRTILTLARSLNMRAVAEGVTSSAQLIALRKLGCEFGQGYLFSPPVPPDEIGALLAADTRW